MGGANRPAMDMQWHRWVAQAREAAQEAGEEIARWIGRGVEVHYKGPSNPVTEVDLRCQKMIRDRLLGANPEHGFLGEEGDSCGLERDYVWIVDPLDGTKNFAHGYPLVAVSIGLQCRGRMVVGVVHDATRRETFSALRGGGAFLNGAPIKVSEQAALEDALLVTGFGGGLEVEYDYFVALDKACQGVRRDGSAALDLCAVASGRLDGMFQINLSPWDVAAGSLLVEEAGGMLTDYQGRPFRVDGRQVVASNVKLHRAMLDVLASRGDEVERLLAQRGV